MGFGWDFTLSNEPDGSLGINYNCVVQDTAPRGVLLQELV